MEAQQIKFWHKIGSTIKGVVQINYVQSLSIPLNMFILQTMKT